MFSAKLRYKFWSWLCLCWPCWNGQDWVIDRRNKASVDWLYPKSEG